MKKVILLVIVALGLWLWLQSTTDERPKSQAQEQVINSFKSMRHSFTAAPVASNPKESVSIEQAQKENLDKVQVYGEGKVIKTLPDDNKGSRHQRFILRTGTDSTVLIVHNIDIAPRLNDLQREDTVGFSGEYISNNRGGLVHWTHHDPKHRHHDGWLLYKNKRYK